jgi:uncharacterized protein YjbI with pentapeptide repeats
MQTFFTYTQITNASFINASINKNNFRSAYIDDRQYFVINLKDNDFKEVLMTLKNATKANIDRCWLFISHLHTVFSVKQLKENSNYQSAWVSSGRGSENVYFA